ncbi:unnamed protein product [Ilex paraguariensis]|uniref:Uncharacterized protein n=1 Tax=Ilex paraguariensis TaxID=185542 RepID=A0ABC8U5R6_9AQUA
MKTCIHREDWSHAFYMGKLYEKLEYSHDISFSYFVKAIALNPLAADPFYRMHASRLKLLYTVVAAYSCTQSTKDTVMNMFDRMYPKTSQSPVDVEGSTDANSDYKLEEGTSNIFIKPDILAQGLYRRGESGDLEKAKEELSFCFKSSRSSFTINMWEIDDLVPVALGRFLKALTSSMHRTDNGSRATSSSLDHLLEKMFSLFLEQVTIWSDICNLPKIKGPKLVESNLHGYLYQYIQLLESNAKLEMLEGMNEKIRKHLKNPKLSNSNCAKIKNAIIKKVSDEDLEPATTLLRSSYNFYRDTSCAMLPSGVNLYMAPSQLAIETCIQLGIDGVDILDMNTSRKLLLWAYTLLTGHCPNISIVIKYGEANAKGGGKDGIGKCSELGAGPTNVGACTRSVGSNTLPESKNKCNVTYDSFPETKRVENVASSSMLETGSSCNVASVSQPKTDSASNVSSSSLPDSKSMHRLNATPSNESQKILSANPCLLQCNSTVPEMSNVEVEPDGGDPNNV